MVRLCVVVVSSLVGVLGTILGLCVSIGYAALVIALSVAAAIICWVSDRVTDSLLGEKVADCLQRLLETLEAIWSFIFGSGW